MVPPNPAPAARPRSDQHPDRQPHAVGSHGFQCRRKVSKGRLHSRHEPMVRVSLSPACQDTTGYAYDVQSGAHFLEFLNRHPNLRQHVLLFVTNAPIRLADVHARDSFPPEGCSPSSRCPLIASLFDPRHPRLELPTPRRPPDSRHPRRSPIVVSSSSRRIVARFRRPRPVPPAPSGFARPPPPSPRCPPSAPPRFSSPRSTPCAEG